ncbi:hypothetical protein GCK72_004037 [Caenorhabditis remanei]|uniref:BZIP domain-containing protein n=1 Tax=Caenorhabditis remanei TaxID=31234 RepID=A0A6A5HB38_CAERE|nr:hypothetical protein GCK72_004037 [Caenorhabditis remanei]KAF1764091.1 hypothetical protein GCK72_004037 [Caenorhabditis remanei]
MEIIFSDGPFYRGASKRKSMTPEDLCDQPRGKEMKVEIVKDEMPSMEKEVVKLEPVEQESDRPPHLFPMISNNGVNPQEIPYLPLESAFEELEKRIRIFTEKLQEGCRMMKESQRIAYVNELENSKMWAPIVENLWNYGYQENAHYHQHHYPSAHHTERFQTLSCPSDVPIDTSYCNNMSPTYQDLGHDLSPQFWCAEVDCAYERCATRVIPRGQSIYFRHDEGIHEASPVNDNLKNNDWEVKKAFRKEQSKVASARYRVKKKAKRQELLDQLEAEEKRNARLKRKFAQLEKDVAEARFHLKLSHK